MKIYDNTLVPTVVEQTGHGVPQIIEHYGKEAFSLYDNSIVVTIKFAFEISNRTIISEGMNTTEKKILEMIKLNPQMSKKELSELLDCGETTVSNAIKSLRQKNIIERSGANKNGYWIIK